MKFILTVLVVFCLGNFNLFANEAECRKTIQNCWKSFCYQKLSFKRYVTKDFVSITSKGKSDVKKISDAFSDYQLMISAIRKKDYSTAADALGRSLNRSLNTQRPCKKFKDLSPEEQQKSINFFEKLLQAHPDKNLVKKYNTMKIKQIKINGQQAEAVITYQYIFNTWHNEKIILKKINKKWYLSSMEAIDKK